jgi:hypothetical protein
VDSCSAWLARLTSRNNLALAYHGAGRVTDAIVVIHPLNEHHYAGPPPQWDLGVIQRGWAPTLSRIWAP